MRGLYQIVSTTYDKLKKKSSVCNLLKESESEALVAQSRLTICDPVDCSPPGSSWNSPGENTRVGSHSLLQGIFPTQGSNPDLLPHRQMSLQGSPCNTLWLANNRR